MTLASKFYQTAAGMGELSDAQNFFIGATLDTADVSVSESGGVVNLTIEKSGGGDIRFSFSDGVYTLDTTPIASVALTQGTDPAPQLNYIYLLQSTKALTVSTVGWPSAEYSPIATAMVQTAASLATDGAYKLHAWTDHVQSLYKGHLADMNEWIRHQPSTWVSGTLAVVTDGVGTFDIAVSSGTSMQLHHQDYPSFDTSTGSEVMMVNDATTAYKRVGDLTGELTDAAGVSLSGKYYNLVFWGVVSEDSGDCQLMCNLPTGSYDNNSGDKAALDIDATASYDIPVEFRGTGFLIARITMRHQSAGGGTFTEQLNTDLRGLFPSTGAGGSPGGGVTELIELTDVDTAPTTQNFVLATPDGVAGDYSGRALVIGDLPAGVGGLAWNVETTTAVTAAVNNGYLTNNAGLVTVTLPTTAAVGDKVRVCGMGAGGWKVAQNASELIDYGENTTTTGVGGSLASTHYADTVELICKVADTEWHVLSGVGNITVT